MRERVRESERERGRESDAVTNTSVAIMLVLAGSRSTVTEITGYKYFSLQKPSRASPNNSESNIAPLDLIIGLISFYVKHNMYILLHACSATVRFLHFWAETISPDALDYCYGVAMVSRIDQIIGLFFKRAL